MGVSSPSYFLTSCCSDAAAARQTGAAAAWTIFSRLALSLVLGLARCTGQHAGLTLANDESGEKKKTLDGTNIQHSHKVPLHHFPECFTSARVKSSPRHAESRFQRWVVLNRQRSHVSSHRALLLVEVGWRSGTWIISRSSSPAVSLS